MKDNSHVPVEYRSKAERVQAGKGSRRRRESSEDIKKYHEGWERVFGKKENDREES